MESDPPGHRDTFTSETDKQQLFTGVSERFGRRLNLYFREKHCAADVGRLVNDVLTRVTAQLERGLPTGNLEALVLETAELVAREETRRHGEGSG